jgi:hypothetical protein
MIAHENINHIRRVDTTKQKWKTKIVNLVNNQKIKIRKELERKKWTKIIQTRVIVTKW